MPRDYGYMMSPRKKMASGHMESMMGKSGRSNYSGWNMPAVRHEAVKEKPSKGLKPKKGANY